MKMPFMFLTLFSLAIWSVFPMVPEMARMGTEPLKLDLPKPAYDGTPRDGGHADIAVEKRTWKPGPVVMVPKGSTNMALGKPVMASDSDPILGNNSQITDGKKEGFEWDPPAEYAPGLQWVQIDLEKTAEVHAVAIWHSFRDPRVYYGMVVQVSNDPTFKSGVTTIYNNDQKNKTGLGRGYDLGYEESNAGKVLEVRGVNARYVRLYSMGNTCDDDNQYTEVEVWGVPKRWFISKWLEYAADFERAAMPWVF